MTEQWEEDRKLLRRIDDYAKGLSEKQKKLLESFMRRVEGDKKPLSETQRKIAEEWDEDYVE